MIVQGHVMTTYRRIRVTVPIIFIHGAIERFVVNITPRPLYSRK
jgi:hypothetical protein